MAWLEQKKSGTFHIVFRIGKAKYRRSLKTKLHKQALTRQLRIEENLALIEAGRLSVPDDADLVTFLLSDGKLEQPIKEQKRLQLGKLVSTYKESLPVGAIEDSSMGTTEVHMRHFVRSLGGNLELRSLSTLDLQKHINVRSQHPGRNGKRLSAGTIKKEIATLRSLWNWAIGNEFVCKPFPNSGLKYPKLTDKEPFRTHDEITEIIEADSLSEQAQYDLWECLYLRPAEISEVVDLVKRQSRHRFIHPMVAIAAYTGARRSEICRSLTKDIDLKKRTILLREKKRNKNRHTFRQVPISTKLSIILEEWLDCKPVGSFTFPYSWESHRDMRGEGNSGPITPNETRHHLSHTLRDSKWSIIIGWHVFRHSFISICASKGVDQRFIDQWAGHQTDQQRQRYRHLFPDTQKQTIESVF